MNERVHFLQPEQAAPGGAWRVFCGARRWSRASTFIAAALPDGLAPGVRVNCPRCRDLVAQLVADRLQGA